MKNNNNRERVTPLAQKHQSIMNNLVIKLSCEKMEQEVSVKQVNGVYVVELATTRNELIPEHTGEVISWSCITYGDALQKYLSLAAEQAKHIALMSL